MKKLPIKVLSCALIAALVLPMAACNKNKGKQREKSRSGEKIAADSPWFYSSIKTFKPEVDSKKSLEYAGQELVGSDDKYYAIHANGYYKVPNNIDWNNFSYNDYAINYIAFVDKETGKIDRKFDLTEHLPKSGNMETVEYEDGKYKIRMSSYDENKNQLNVIKMVCDAQTGKVLDKKEMPYDESNYHYYEHTFDYGSFTVKTSTEWDEMDKGYCLLTITDSEGENEQTIEIKDKELNIYDCPIILKSGEDKLIVATSTDKDHVFYEVDVNALTATVVDSKKYDWLDIDGIYNTFMGKDGTVYFSNADGISKINLEKKAVEDIFKYSWCSVNRAYLSYLQLVECSDDSMILWGEKAMTTYVPGVVPDYMLITLDRAETNPHAGKTILELYAPYSSVDINVGEAIVKFNDTNGSYYIEATDRYLDTDDDSYSDVNSEDDWAKANMKYNANMSNELAMDILNGEGPDILLNTSSLGQLNSDTYLVDLNKYIGTLSSDKYFTNVTEAAQNGGKLYQLPLCYMISGIQTKAEYAGKSGVGFTTEEYEKFLKDKLNGKDVMNYGQAAYFSMLFTAMSDKFFVDGKADFTGPEFAALAEFVKNNVPEKAKSWDELYNNYGDVDYTYAVGVAGFKGDTMESQIAMYTSVYGFNSYFASVGQLNGATAILGIPSSDGRGPMLDSYISVAISSQSKNVDACGEFVKMLMTDDAQMELAKGGNFVLNKEAFRAGAKEAVDFMNGPGGESYLGYDRNGDPVSNRMKFSDKNIDELENIIKSISGMNSTDAAIGLILIEEMPSYFSGQKDLNDVVKIAQDRAQKVIGERG